MNLTIIVPVYNEEKTILTILDRLKSISTPGVGREIIVINDGSTDDTALKITNHKSQITNLIVVNHKKNMGKGTAIKTGIQHSAGDYILIQDADLEYNPKDIPRLIEPILLGKADVVYGTRLKRLPNLKKDERTFRFLLHYFGNKFLSFITSVLYGQWITDMETCYKLFPRKALKGVTLRSKGFDFGPEITSVLLKKGHKIFEVTISTTPRGYMEGKKLNTFRDGIIALWTLLARKFND